MDVLILVQNNESYSRENTPVLVHIQGDTTQTSGDVSKEKTKTPIQNTKTKMKPFTFCTCPDVYAGPSWNKQLTKELQAPDPGRTRFGELNPRR